jgi:DNA-directed RNA polymerase subunit F
VSGPSADSRDRSSQRADRASDLTSDQREALQNRAENMTPEQRQALQEKAANMTPEQKEQIKSRLENLTPEQKEQLRQKYEESGLTPSQLPSEGADREDWQDWKDQNREDWQDWYEDEYHDYWDDHYYPVWWYGYPVTTMSYSFYLDDDPPCSRTVVVNNAGGYASTYYHCDSVWYRSTYASGEVRYVVTSPPPGAELDNLTDAYQVMVNGKEYFVSGHAFYQTVTRDGKPVYVLVDPPLGAEVKTIPQYAVEIKHQEQSYYRYDKIFYQRKGDVFVIVANPGV